MGKRRQKIGQAVHDTRMCVDADEFELVNILKWQVSLLHWPFGLGDV